jgi:hypothetical protein
MGSEPNGAPWPDGTAQLRDGDDAIKALAQWADPRAPFRVAVFAGGYTTNQYGGITFTLPFQTVNAAAVAYVGTGSPIMLQRSPAAPAGQAWINAINSTNGTLVANTFIQVDVVIWGS